MDPIRIAEMSYQIKKLKAENKALHKFVARLISALRFKEKQNETK